MGWLAALFATIPGIAALVYANKVCVAWCECIFRADSGCLGRFLWVPATTPLWRMRTKTNR